MTPALSTLSKFSKEYTSSYSLQGFLSFGGIFSSTFSTSKQNTESDSLLNRPIPPRSKILDDEILQVENLLRGIVILMSNKDIFFELISNRSIELSVPSSLL